MSTIPASTNVFTTLSQAFAAPGTPLTVTNLRSFARPSFLAAIDSVPTSDFIAKVETPHKTVIFVVGDDSGSMTTPVVIRERPGATRSSEFILALNNTFTFLQNDSRLKKETSITLMKFGAELGYVPGMVGARARGIPMLDDVLYSPDQGETYFYDAYFAMGLKAIEFTQQLKNEGYSYSLILVAVTDGIDSGSKITQAQIKELNLMLRAQNDAMGRSRSMLIMPGFEKPQVAESMEAMGFNHSDDDLQAAFAIVSQVAAGEF